MKAKFKGIEFEIENEIDLRLVLSLADGGSEQVYSQEEEEIKPDVKLDKPKRTYNTRRRSRKWKHWTAEEDAILKKYPLSKAKTMLPGRTMASMRIRLDRQAGKRGGLPAKTLNFEFKDGKERQLKFPTHGWTSEMDEIVKTYPIDEAAKRLSRTKSSVYNRRRTLKIAKKQRHKFIGVRVDGQVRGKAVKPEAPKMPEASKISFDIFKNDAEEAQKTEILLDLIKHSRTANRKISLNELVSVFQITVSEAKALVMDIFQQQFRINKILGLKKIILSNPSSPILSFE
jgi:hypothetical protein